MIFKVEENEKTESHLLKLFGLTIGFDETEWFDGSLMLCFDGQYVASLDGELLEAFKNDVYVIDNRLVE
ncbi:hypothetical protein D2H34_004609 [Vibrio fluvialis]